MNGVMQLHIRIACSRLAISRVTHAFTLLPHDPLGTSLTKPVSADLHYQNLSHLPFPQEERLRAAKEKGLIGVNAGKRLRARLSSYQQALRDIQEGEWLTESLQPSSISAYISRLCVLQNVPAVPNTALYFESNIRPYLCKLRWYP